MTVYRVYDAHTGKLQLEGTAQELVDMGAYRTADNVRSCYKSNLRNRMEKRACKVIWDKLEAEDLAAKWMYCRDCGRKIQASDGVCYRPECQEIRSPITEDQWATRMAEKIARESAKHPKISIDEAVKLATEAGLSYGKWEAKRRLAR